VQVPDTMPLGLVFPVGFTAGPDAGRNDSRPPQQALSYHM
jgi:hypothetical protein